ncbi:MAG: hypothetical protein ACREX8_09795, partial [Gammaproteobacteria bacterium]
MIHIEIIVPPQTLDLVLQAGRDQAPFRRRQGFEVLDDGRQTGQAHVGVDVHRNGPATVPVEHRQEKWRGVRLLSVGDAVMIEDPAGVFAVAARREGDEARDAWCGAG